MNKRNARIICLILCLPIFIGWGEANHDAIDVSLINLIATPASYHGKIIRVIGVANIEFEGNAIYLSKEHLENGVTKNALWITPNYHALGKTEKDLLRYNGQYVLVEGVFNKDKKGHMGLCSGSIDNITRYEPWPPDIIKSKESKG